MGTSLAAQPWAGGRHTSVQINESVSARLQWRKQSAMQGALNVLHDGPQQESRPNVAHWCLTYSNTVPVTIARLTAGPKQCRSPRPL